MVCLPPLFSNYRGDCGSGGKTGRLLIRTSMVDPGLRPFACHSVFLIKKKLPKAFPLESVCVCVRVCVCVSDEQVGAL